MYQARVVPVDTEEGAGEVYEVGRLATMAERVRGDLDVVGEEGEEEEGVTERGDMIRRLRKLGELDSTVPPTFSDLSISTSILFMAARTSEVYQGPIWMSSDAQQPSRAP